MKRIAIIGSGHLGQQIAHHIHHDSSDKVVAFFDEFQPVNTIIGQTPVIGGNNDVITKYQQNEFDAVLIAIGYKHLETKKEMFQNLDGKVPFYTFVHSSCYRDPSAFIGQGAVLYPGCVIDQNVRIEDNVLMNISCTVAHDSIIGKHSFLSPSVAIAGFVNIQEQCIIGINSTIIDNITIAAKTQIGGGGVVIKDIDTSGLYVGNPVKFIR
ncbi:acetyltransferase [Chryseobacterium lathyri]|uniref:Sugar O-acyltransferase (Sialic acid O-acetyltransferase NeuD family) n=1 Tax=Chryseobacterium lathyri TaxID=395933 RepID=A0ABT9SIW3_9FLAO|nr:acetyltransferase [Chryseobacterium lathyri]MDP9958405.1 sugar O-acyltransferase (sialic acid O-acetyltransferase NeuD family) [Chryseobacterium lathyri]MDQ0066438.1 sugar O-acyltransferase (sialic acid O-acetyltransferase NeuD family) [Chryseobacterium lathyri]